MRPVLRCALALTCGAVPALAQQLPSSTLQDLSRCSAARGVRARRLPPPAAMAPPAPSAAPRVSSDAQVFVGATPSGPTEQAWYFDVVADRLEWSVDNPETDGLNGGCYTHAGNKFYLSCAGQLTRADLRANPPTWSTIYAPQEHGPFDVQADGARKLVYFLAHPLANNTDELLAIDIDPASSTYQQVVASTTSLSQNPFLERFGLSASGRRAACVSALVRYLHVVDTDPASATYMGVLYEGPIPHAGPFPVITDAVVTSDDTQVLITIQRGGGAPSEIARFDLTTMGWMDHDPNQAGIQHIGPFSDPVAPLGAAAFDIDLASDDSFVVVCGWNAEGWAGRLDLDPAQPATWSWTAYAPPSGLADAWALDLDSQDHLVSIETQSEALVLNARTGDELRKFPIPIATNVYLVRMR